MRLPETPNMPAGASNAYEQALNRLLQPLFQKIAQKVNQLADGRIAGNDLVAAVIPTTGTYAAGDFVKNSAPAELGAVASKYVITGWICVTAGTPGTFRECRVLTGN